MTPRTVRRWQEGEEVPGPVQQAITAWIRLHERHLPWRPDSVSIVEDDQDQIARHRSHTVNLADVIQRVEARGGARAPWSVDWDQGRASLETMEVTFYKLASGGFSLGWYRRTDSAPDITRDREMIEDAIYSISKTLERKSPDYGPVTVVTQDGPAKGRVSKQQLREFSTAAAAVRHVCERIETFHDPFVMTKEGELLWDTRELRRECIRRSDGPPALSELADYVRQHSSLFVQGGPGSLRPAERASRIEQIKALANETDKLAERARDGSVQYQQFEEVLGALHAAGFFPAGHLVGNVADALEGVRQ